MFRQSSIVSESLKKIAKVYLAAIIIFLIFRMILFFSEIKRVDIHQDGFWNIIYAFIMGIRFDLVVTGYIMLLPTTALLVLEWFNKKWQWIEKIIFYWIFIFFSLTFIICAADIPYFNQFFMRFSARAFDWMDNTEFVFSMIIQEPRYYIIVIPLIILIIIFYKILKFILTTTPPLHSSPFGIKFLISILTISLVLLGIRGRIQLKSPIRVGTAYFCNNSFLNQLGLNPAFTLVHSFIQDKKNKNVHFANDLESIIYVQKWLNIEHQIYNSPIARNICPDTLLLSKPNVVLIIMESMSAAKMGRFGNQENLTPFLDSISRHSYFFENIYSAGIHTHNGIFGTLFSFPSIYNGTSCHLCKQYPL